MMCIFKKVLFILMLLQYSSLYSQWKSIGPNGGSVLKFIEHDSILFAVTTDGGMYRSTNKGLSWSNPTFRNNTPILDCITSDQKNLYATSGNQLFISTDFGLSWNKPITIPEGGTSFIAAKDSMIILSNGGYIYYSTNNGKKWYNLWLAFGPYDQAINAFVSRDSLFVAVRYDNIENNSLQLFKSGLKSPFNWELMHSFPTTSGDGDNMFMVDGENFYVTTNNLIRKSNNYGKTFDSISLSLGFDYSDWMFDTKGTSFVVSKNYMGTWVSTDTCRTWSTLSPELYFAHALPYKQRILGAEGFRYCSGYQGLRYFGQTGEGIFYYNSSSKDWTPSNSGFTNTDINTISAAGSRLYTYDQKRQQKALFYSDNEGENWIKEPYFPHPIVSLTANNFYLFIGTAEQGLFRSVTGSNNWTRIDTAVSIEQFIKQLMDGETNIFYQANLLTIRNYWRMNNSQFKNLFIHKYNVLAHGFDSIVGKPSFFKSNNFGKTWIPISTPFKNVKLFAANHDFVFAVSGELYNQTSDEGLYRSADMGNTWEKLNTPLPQNEIVKAIGCFENILILAAENKIVVSRDNGVTWTDMSDSLPDHIACFSFYKNHLYVGTQYKGIWKRNIHELFGETKSINTIEAFNVSVYPNPFNNYIMVGGTLNQTENLTYELLDMSGRLIIKNKINQPQNKQIKINTAELAEGIYVFTVKTDKGVFNYKITRYSVN